MVSGHGIVNGYGSPDASGHILHSPEQISDERLNVPNIVVYNIIYAFRMTHLFSSDPGLLCTYPVIERCLQEKMVSCRFA